MRPAGWVLTTQAFQWFWLDLSPVATRFLPRGRVLAALPHNAARTRGLPVSVLLLPFLPFYLLHFYFLALTYTISLFYNSFRSLQRKPLLEGLEVKLKGPSIRPKTASTFQ